MRDAIRAARNEILIAVIETMYLNRLSALEDGIYDLGNPDSPIRKYLASATPYPDAAFNIWGYPGPNIGHLARDIDGRETWRITSKTFLPNGIIESQAEHNTFWLLLETFGLDMENAYHSGMGDMTWERVSRSHGTQQFDVEFFLHRKNYPDVVDKTASTKLRFDVKKMVLVGGDISNAGANVANYDRSALWNNEIGNVTTVGSAGPFSESYYGTADQGGNVSEWTEGEFNGSFGRRIRGGSWKSSQSALARCDYVEPGQFTLNDEIGFRIASSASESEQYDFDWVTVGDLFNSTDDCGRSYGSVDYAYRIAKHEVTNAQYVEFLNAVASSSDLNGLYDTDWEFDPRYGIERTVSSPYTYSVKQTIWGTEYGTLRAELMSDKPVTYVSFLRVRPKTSYVHGASTPISALVSHLVNHGGYIHAQKTQEAEWTPRDSR